MGKSWVAEFHMVALEIPQFSGESWETEIAFLIADIPLSYGVLGHRGFLDRWTVTFNYHKNYFIIERPDDFEQRKGIDPEDMGQGTFDSEWDRPTDT